MNTNIIPGNYFLTKSMEWQRFNKTVNGEVVDLGNYWFIKKFITYYYYIFTKKLDIESRDIYSEISKIFTIFISSLPEELQDNAEKYFFEIDIRDENKIFKWNDFYNIKMQPDSSRDAYKYKTTAKKIYFTYLMQLGGQSGEKKKLLYYDIPQKIPFHELVEKYSSTVINDVHAILRNMRQVFYYYGFMYRFETNQIEEYSLTHIGQLLLISNWNELSIVMEHQKIKMISQPPTVSIYDVANKGYEQENFNIEINPYLRILKFIQNNGAISVDQFKYIVSRNVPLDSNFDEMQEKIQSFARGADKKSEDFNKELKKYLYGLSDSSQENLDFLKYKSYGTSYILLDGEKLKNYIDFIEGYKIQKDKIFSESKGVYENILKRFYSNNKIEINYKDIYRWYSYISMPDESLLISLLIFLESTEKKFSQIKSSYPNISKYLQIKSIDWLNYTEIKNSTTHLNLIYKLVFNRINESSNDLELVDQGEVTFRINHINDLVNKSDEFFDELQSKSRKHIAYIKSYYENMNVNYCDCCGEISFKKNNGKKYFEYHHLIPISESGPDHVLNIFGVCATCHRKFHFENEDDRVENYVKINNNNYLAVQNYSNSSIYNRMKYLFNHGYVNLLALEFLVKEKFLKDNQIEELILQANRIGE
ncbi:hypothetical protein BOVMAS36_16350 [Streptococcus uberis]